LSAKAYIKSRRLQMVIEAKKLEKERVQITQQAQQLQSHLNQVNSQLLKLDVELELLDKLEVSLNGHKIDSIDKGVKDDAGSNCNTSDSNS